MFITLLAKDRDGQEKETKINTSQIVFIVESYVHMGNTAILELDEENMKLLEESLYGSLEEILPTVNNHKPTELSILLNELHKLLGGRGEAKFTTDRKARLTTRLKDFSPEELKLAATNLGEDEFMQGANDNGKRYGTIDYLIRTSANVNKYLDMPDKKPKSMF